MMEDLEMILRMLGNPTRLRILRRLSMSPTYFLDLVRLLDLGPQAVMRHLSVMEEAGLVRSWHERNSNRKYFGLAKRIKVTVDVDSGELRCQTSRIPKLSGMPTIESVSDPWAVEEMRRIEEELELLERRLNTLRQRRLRILKRYCK